VDFDAHERSGGQFIADAELPPATVLLSPAEALKRSRDAFRERHGMTQLVEFRTGDFRSISGKFDLVFADVRHERMKFNTTWPIS
jgi:hypothetical protein